MQKKSFGKFIAKRRKSLGLTQEQLADRVSVSKSAIAKWETDGGLPDRDNLKRLAESLDMTADSLHSLIAKHNGASGKDPNITPDVIAALEARGYTVIGPEEEKK